MKFDLHIHSIASEYKESSGIVDKSTVENIETLFEKLEENEVGLFSITDHNRFNVDLYKKIDEIIRKGDYPKVKGVLAGVEFDVKLDDEMNKCHIITIFDAKNKEENYKNVNLQEDIIYKSLLEEFEKDKKENVIHILTYSFTEILNNAIEHSESKDIKISYAEDYFSIYVQILDDGVGIFKKIKKNYNLKNENEAIFELKKGKITSDPENHSGEEIFFSSKVVDYFLIDSYNKNFYSGNKDYFYHFEQNKKENIKGTLVYFIIDKNTNRTTKEVFDSYTDDDYVFNKTEITVHLAEEYLGEHLISRSIARRILSNIEKFKVIFLDFNGVKTIGPAFADEIFRVFRNKHKEITILPINMNEEVKFMIKRVDKNIVIE